MQIRWGEDRLLQPVHRSAWDDAGSRIVSTSEHLRLIVDIRMGLKWPDESRNRQSD